MSRFQVCSLNYERTMMGSEIWGFMIMKSASSRPEHFNRKKQDFSTCAITLQKNEV